MSLKGFDTERREAIDRQLLTDAMKAEPGCRFKASELTGYTAGKSELRPKGVPKLVVRRRLTDIPSVRIGDEPGGPGFRGRPSSADVTNAAFRHYPALTQDGLQSRSTTFWC
jgi:hypothetical protein